MKDGEIYGGACAVADLKKNGLDEQVKKAEESFISEPYQSSKNGGMVMTVVAMAPDDDRIDALYVSVMIENLKSLGFMSFYRQSQRSSAKGRFGKLYYMY